MASEAQFKGDLKAGYVYLLSSPHKPGAIRIGTTMRDIGKVRHEPFGTEAPVACKVEFAIHVPDRGELERVLHQRFAAQRVPNEDYLFKVKPDAAVSAIIETVGFEYTNAAVTGVIFQKQVAALRKMEADFRNRHKSFGVLNTEVGELREQLRAYRDELADRDSAIETLHRRIDEMKRTSKAKLRRYMLYAAMTAIAVIGVAALSYTFLT